MLVARYLRGLKPIYYKVRIQMRLSAQAAGNLALKAEMMLHERSYQEFYARYGRNDNGVTVAGVKICTAFPQVVTCRDING